MQYFIKKLTECDQKLNKEENDKQDLVIFSILLLTSRLAPFAWAHQEEGKDKEEQRDFRMKLFSKPEVKQQLETFSSLIRSYSGSATYFVRKISAQSLLPLLHFS